MKITKKSVQKLLKKLWSNVVRTRDGFACQWCGKVSNRNHAHHIVAKSLCNKIGFYDPRNGMTLCFRCHIVRLKSEVDEYIAFRDKWLARRSMNYVDLRKEYMQKSNMILDDYLAMLHNLKIIYGKLTDESESIYDDTLPEMSAGKTTTKKRKR